MFRGIARKKQYGLADLLLPFGLVDKGVLLQTDGSLLAGWRYSGPDLAMATEGQMAAISDRLNDVARLGAGWMIQSNAIRSATDYYPPPGMFPDPITNLIDEERRQQNKAAGCRLENEYFLTLTYLPPTRSQHAMTEWMHGSKNDGAAAKALATFQAAIERFENVFQEIFNAQRLTSRQVQTGWGSVIYDDLLAYYRRCITGVNATFVSPDIPAYLNDVLAPEDWTGGEQIKLGDKHIIVLAIDGFPKRSVPVILSRLDSLDIEYRWSTRIILLNEAQGYNAYKKIYAEHNASKRGVFARMGYTDGGDLVDQYSVNRAGEAEQAMNDAKEGNVQTCIYNGSVVLMGSDRAKALELARAAMKEIQMAGFSARIETINAAEAWLGTLPGDGYADVRRVYMNTLNAADLMPLSAVWTGRLVNPSPRFPPNSPPMMVGATAGGSPFRFNTHVSDVGNQLVIGPAGSGKSAFLALQAAQFMRYPGARVIVIDRGYSMWPLTMAVGGEFYDAATEGENAGWCPLAHLDEPGEIQWASQWFEDLCGLSGLHLIARQRTVVAEALRVLASLPRHQRTLTHAKGVIQDEQIRAVLEYFTGDGPAAHLFDADREAFGGTGRVVCVETGRLMGLDQRALMPALMLLFHRIEKTFDGQPTLLILDEAALALDHDRFVSQIKKWLLTIRKENVSLILCAQQLSAIAESKIATTILGECPTKVYLPNPDAGSKGAGALLGSNDFYHAAGLNSKRIEAIRAATPKRDYLITSPEGCVMVDFQLGPVALAFCGLNGQEQRAKLAEVMEQGRRSGEDWRANWLRARYLDDWAEYLEGSRSAHSFAVTA